MTLLCIFPGCDSMVDEFTESKSLTVNKQNLAVPLN